MKEETISQVHQDYLSYSFKNDHRDIVLKEYESAERLANSQSKLFQQFAGVLGGIVTLLTPTLIQFTTSTSYSIVEEYVIISIIFSLSVLTLLYFVELQKTLIFNARKVVVLRKMLGLDYGSLLLVLPSWRIEGASNPTRIKLFPGWITIVTVPLWIVVLFFSVTFFVLSQNLDEIIPWPYLFVPAVTLLVIFFRWRLLDHHETFYLFIVKFIASLLRINFPRNFQHIMYKTKLSAYELDRLHFNLSNIKGALVAIEDKKFYKHKGVDWFALFRSFISIFPIVRRRKGILKSGGSTISMQLSRGLFIDASCYRKLFRRKIIEILLAKWLDKELNKDLILGMYLASVRYDKDVFGLAAATKYFFNKRIRQIDKEQSLFLVERVSSVSKLYSSDRIQYLINSVADFTGWRADLLKLKKIYREAGVRQKRVRTAFLSRKA